MKYFIILLLSASVCVDGLKILGLFPHHGKSHHDVFEPLLLALADKGHQITIVSHFTPSRRPEGWRQISMGNYAEMYREIVDLKLFEADLYGLERYIFVRDFIMMTIMAKEMCETITALPEVKNMINEKEKFDVIFVEQFTSDCALGIAHILDAPVIALQSHVMMPWTGDRFGQPDNPSYIPSIFLHLGTRLSFFERVENTFFQYSFQLLYKYIVLNPEKEIVQRNLNRTIPCLQEIAKNTSLMLANTHYTLNGVRPFVPAIVEIGGIHVKQSMKKLEPDLEKYINGSKHGVVIFSMGSMIKAATFPAAKRDAFLKTFADLKQNVIWKWEGEPIADLPKNVLIQKWLPQLEVLHHPNTVAFISHAGLLGLTEAVHAGVPCLFIPVFGDQHVNAATAEEAGMGVKIEYKYVTEQRVREGMEKVLSPEMRRSAKSLSEAWKDRRSPLEVAIEHVEYIARHGGKRLQSTATNLPLYQLLLLDVWLFFAAILCIILFIFKKIILFIISLFVTDSSKKNSNSTKTNNKHKTQ